MKQPSLESQDASRTRSLAVLGLLVFCTPLVVVGLGRARFADSVAVDHVVGAAPSADRVTVTWAGSRVDDPRIQAFSDKLLGTPGPDGVIRGGSPLIAKVTVPAVLMNAMTSEDVPSESAAQALTGFSLGRGGLKIRATDAGRRDLTWTSKRIHEALAAPGRVISITPRNYAATVAGADTGHVEDFDLEVFCTDSAAPGVQPADLKDGVLAVRGFPTAEESEGQRLIKDVFWTTGSPVAIHVELSEAGHARILAADAAIRQAATVAGVAEQDLLVVGNPIDQAVKAQSLQRLAFANESESVLGYLTSPLSLSLISAALLLVILCGVTTEIAVVSAVALFGTAAFSAAVNFAGYSWTASLLTLVPLHFFGVVAIATLSQRASEHPQNVPDKALLLSATIPIVCAVAILCVSDFSATSSRSLGLCGVAACGSAWMFAALVTPAIQCLLSSGTRSHASLAPDFSAWAHTHTRAALATGLALIAGVAAFLAQPGAQAWVADSIPGVDPASSRFRYERALGGTDELVVAINFSADAQQALRFVERNEIVRQATQHLRDCDAVTGAISLADLAPAIEPLSPDASTRERLKWLQASRRVENRIREGSASLGGEWLTPQAGAEENQSNDLLGLSTTETWLIRSAVRQIDMTSRQDLLHTVDVAIQDVLRFHAGVTHELRGDLLAEQSAASVRRPRFTALVAGAGTIVAAIVLRSLLAGMANFWFAAFPIVLCVVPGFGRLISSPVEALALVVPLLAGLVISLQLIVRYRQALAMIPSRAEALADALSQVSRRGRAVISCGLILLLTPVVFSNELFGVAGRIGALATLWAVVSSLVVLPLMLSGKVGEWIGGTAVSPADLHSEASGEISTVPVRLDSAPVPEGPHFALRPAQQRKRHAG